MKKEDIAISIYKTVGERGLKLFMQSISEDRDVVYSEGAKRRRSFYKNLNQENKDLFFEFVIVMMHSMIMRYSLLIDGTSKLLVDDKTLEIKFEIDGKQIKFERGEIDFFTSSDHYFADRFPDID